jgi:uncharacterized membrane protein YidH (DUF202 family)
MNFLFTNIAHAGKVDEFVFKVDKFIINPLILLLFGLAILIFLYGVVEFLISQSSEEKKTTGKNHMIWGILGITIMLGVWTILGFVLNVLGVKGINPQEGKVELLPPPRI